MKSTFGCCGAEAARHPIAANVSTAARARPSCMGAAAYHARAGRSYWLVALPPERGRIVDAHAAIERVPAGTVRCLQLDRHGRRQWQRREREVRALALDDHLRRARP